MIATDPLSLLFLSCVVFSGAFLFISALTGTGHGHGLHLGHAGHAGHIGHAGVGHGLTTHGAGGHAGHAAGHSGTSGSGASTGQGASVSPLMAAWYTTSGVLLGTLNLFSLLTFLVLFGLLGYVFHNATNLGVVLSILLPALVGTAGAMVMGVLLSRLLGHETGLLTAEDTSLEGRIGKVSLAIRPGGVGEVIFQRAGGGRQSIGARSLDGSALSPDAEIVIVSVFNGIANVQSWDTFLRGVRSGHAPPLDAVDAAPSTPPRDPIQSGAEVMPGQDR